MVSASRCRHRFLLAALGENLLPLCLLAPGVCWRALVSFGLELRASLRSLSSHGCLLSVSLCSLLLQAHRCLDLGCPLINMISTSYICNLQVRYCLEIPGGHAFWGDTVQPSTYLKLNSFSLNLCCPNFPIIVIKSGTNSV